MKIIHVITSFALGGAERVSIDLGAGQVMQGHDVSIVALRRTPADQKEFAESLLKEIQTKGISAVDIAGRDFRLSIPIMIYKIVRILRREKPDIMHLHADPAEFIGSLASRITKINVVRTMHNTIIWPTHAIIGWISEHAFRDETVIAVSNDVLSAYEAMRKRFGLTPAEGRSVILNGVPIPEEAPRPKINDNLRLAFFGRNNYQKGINDLAEAIEKLSSREEVSFSLDLYSDISPGEFFTSPTDRIKITVYPPTPKARQLMAEYDLLVIPSHFEGLGLVPLESMAVGTPVLLTDAPGLREPTPEGWPLVVPIEDPDALADKIEEVCTGKHDLADLSKIARAQAKNFSVERQVEQYMEVYNDCLKRSEIKQ